MYAPDKPECPREGSDRYSERSVALASSSEIFFSTTK